MLSRFKKKINNLSPQLYWREIMAVLLLLVAYFFFRSERREINAIMPQLRHAKPVWVITGTLITLFYVLFQSGMYIKSFDAIGIRFVWKNAVELFLKRNFLSVFLPAGGVSSLAYTPSQIRKSDVSKIQIHQATGLYVFAGMLTIFFAGLPVMLFTIFSESRLNNAWLGLLAIAIVILLISITGRSLQTKGSIYRLIQKKIPRLVSFIDELFAANVSTKQFSGAILFSMGVELSGMLHLFIAMLALGLTPSFGAAAVAYIVAVLLMIVSPFLRGLGAVELSIVYVLSQFGYMPAQALAVTILYRVFEFWLPLLAGFLTFAWKGHQIFVRLFPALLIFFLGVVNIISVVTPPLANRLELLHEFLPVATIHASNLLVLLIGVTLMVTAAFMIRGLRNAWLIALILSVFSFIGHLTKALDYEEALFAAITIVTLLISAKQYRLRGNKKLMKWGFATVALVFAAVSIFSFVGFYFIDVKHFGVDFTWQRSLWHTAKSFLLVNDNELHPGTHFGIEFTVLIRLLGLAAWLFLLFTLIKPYINTGTSVPAVERAKFLVDQYGSSPVDYFKMNKDKLHFFSDVYDAFIAYRIANGFSIVLEEPVCREEDKLAVLLEFDMHCRKMGLKTAFYRVDENSIAYFKDFCKQKLLIGQEAILKIDQFSLEGKDKKSLRNGLNSLQKKGFSTAFHQPPMSEVLNSQLKEVSDEWLKTYHRKEFTFSQGMFDARIIQQQPVITVSDERGKIISFLNIIPDFAPDECTYDLIRKTADAPGGCMDALIIECIAYAKRNQLKYLNLGLVPMTGNQQPDNTAEQLMRYASEKLKRFSHYQGLRNFKEKYATAWQNKYLVYDNDFDLLLLPAALNKVMQP